MEETKETKVVVATKGVGDKSRVTFYKDVFITGYDAMEVDPEKPEIKWHRVSYSDGKQQLTNVTADKCCEPQNVQVFKPYKVGVEVTQEITKQGQSIFRLKIVYLEAK